MRRRMLLPQDNVKRYGGIVCRVDDASYSYSYGGIDDYYIDTLKIRFLSEVIDSGASNLSITFGYQEQTPLDLDTMRCFNDITQRCNDYWRVQSSVPTITKTMRGRYYCFTIEKNIASYFYVYDNTNQRYLLKGDDVV